MYEQITEEYQNLISQIEIIRSELLGMPEGRLICCKDRNTVKWIRRLDQQNKILSKKDKTLASQLAYKGYLTLKLKALEVEKKSMQKYFIEYEKNIGRITHKNSPFRKAEDMLEDYRYKDLLMPYFPPSREDLIAWQNETYQKNPYHPENLTVPAPNKEKVRSKSEASIMLVLMQNQIPFRYECALELPNKIIYPDFTIRHPRTGEFFYWEHNGRMGDTKYANRAINKLYDYKQNGIYPAINLIITSETLEKPLDINYVQTLVEYYFGR